MRGGGLWHWQCKIKPSGPCCVRLWPQNTAIHTNHALGFICWHTRQFSCRLAMRRVSENQGVSRGCALIFYFFAMRRLGVATNYNDATVRARRQEGSTASIVSECEASTVCAWHLVYLCKGLLLHWVDVISKCLPRARGSDV